MALRRNLAQAYTPEQYAELAKAYAAPVPDAGMTDRDLAELFGREQGPVYSIGQGIAEAGSKIGEAYLRKKAREKQQVQQAGDYKSLAEAMGGATAPMPAATAFQKLGGGGVAEDQSSIESQIFSPQKTPQGNAPDNLQLAALMQGVPDRLKMQALPMIQQQMAATKAASQPQILPAAKRGEVIPQKNPDGSITTAFEAPPETPKPSAPHVVGNNLVDDKGGVLYTDAAAEARAVAEAARKREADDSKDRPQTTPYVSRVTGNPAKFRPMSNTYVDGENAIDPKDLVPATDFNKDVEAGRGIIGDISNADRIMGVVKANPGAFSADKVNSARARSHVPFIGDQMATAVFTPEENTVRAQVAQEAAAVINKFYGAALSAGENVRANTFAPGPNDTLEQLLPKLEAAKAWAMTKRGSLIPSAISAAERQIGAGVPTVPGSPTDYSKMSDDEIRAALAARSKGQ